MRIKSEKLLDQLGIFLAIPDRIQRRIRIELFDDRHPILTSTHRYAIRSYPGTPRWQSVRRALSKLYRETKHEPIRPEPPTLVNYKFRVI
jgi:hypothetical protein